MSLNFYDGQAVLCGLCGKAYAVGSVHNCPRAPLGGLKGWGSQVMYCPTCANQYVYGTNHTCSFINCRGCGLRYPAAVNHKCRANIPEETRLVKTLSGKGFIVTPTDTIPGDLEEQPDLEVAQDRATQLLDRFGAVIIWAPICVIRPKKDIVAKFTKFGGTFRALGAGEKEVKEP